MKFARLDSIQMDHHDGRDRATKYQYLDDLLDKTFVTDYFLDRSEKSLGIDTATRKSRDNISSSSSSSSSS